MYLRYLPARRNKIQDAWAPEVFLVKDIQGTTYVVEPMGGGVQKRVHRSDIRLSLVLPPLPALRSKVCPVKVSSPQMEKPSIPSVVECVVVEHTWQHEDMQSRPMVGPPRSQAEVVVESELGQSVEVKLPVHMDIDFLQGRV